MSWATELKTIYYLTLRRPRGADHATRMESFYAGQAACYDAFRERMLHGRRELYQAIPFPENGTWIDLGTGTGRSLEYVDERIPSLKQVFLVDVSPSMLAIARQRIDHAGWKNVHTVQADATTFQPPSGLADVVTISYAFSMIPHWRTALEHACALLKPGGLLGVVDFYTSPPHPAPGLVRHSWSTRTFWPVWFARGGVTVPTDLLPSLHQYLVPLHLVEARGRLPYLPLLRIPWFSFIGSKKSWSTDQTNEAAIGV